jgi:hypothetical protein
VVSKWAVPPSGGLLDYVGEGDAKRQLGAKRQRELEVGPSERFVRLFTIEVTLDQTL